MQEENKEKNILKEIIAQSDLDKKIKLYLDNENIINGVYNDKDLKEHTPLCMLDSLILTCTLQDFYIRQKLYKESKDLVDGEIMKQMLGNERSYDYILSRIILNFFISIKLNDNSTDGCVSLHVFFSLLTANKVMKNKHCVTILTNIVLNILVHNNLFKECKKYFDTEIVGSTQLCFFNYYKGRVYLVSEEYNLALEAFQYASILSPTKRFSRFLDKFMITTLVLTSSIFALKTFKWRKSLIPYYEICHSMEKGDSEMFKTVFWKNKEVFIRDGLFSVLIRLYRNVIQEGIRKISLIYYKIKLADIGNILNLEKDVINFLLAKNIKNGSIKGIIENDIFISENEDREVVNISAKIAESIDTHHNMTDMMRYPKSEPPRFETIDRTSLAYEFD